MLATYLLSLREGLEAALIIGIVLGAVSKIRRTDLTSSVWLGTLGAVVVSILTAIVLTSFGMDGLRAIGFGVPAFAALAVLASAASALFSWHAVRYADAHRSNE